MDTRVRFAPSPTGNVHIGNIRTAIFNWLYARHTNGKFLLRVEDTDKARSTQTAINKMLDCMTWLGLDYDEDIYYQSGHEEEHQEAARKLVAEKKAYYKPVPNGEKSPVLFRIPWDVQNCPNIRNVGNIEYNIHADVPVEIDSTGIRFAQVSKKGKPVEFSGCLAGFRQLKVFDQDEKLAFDLEDNIEAVLNEKKVFKLENCGKISFLRHEVFYTDLIKGELAKPLDTIKDLVIVRGDGSPVFHLANVCDDAAQCVSHIIRGDDHVENTYRHILLFNALGFGIPQYAHMPMIVNKAGKPYSKRDGDAFVGDFKEKGFLPEALFNYLSLLGWSPGDNREKMSKDEMVEAFSLERVKSAPAQFDSNKLLNMNGMYMAELSHIKFLQSVYDETIKQQWGNSIESTAIFENVAELLHSRTKIFTQVSDWKYFFFEDSPFFFGDIESVADIEEPMFNYDVKSLKKAIKKDEVRNGLKSFAESLRDIDDFSIDIIINLIHSAEQSAGLDEGKLNQGLRIALTGMRAGAGLHETIELLGKERVEERIIKVLEAFEKINN